MSLHSCKSFGVTSASVFECRLVFRILSVVSSASMSQHGRFLLTLLSRVTDEYRVDAAGRSLVLKIVKKRGQ